MDDACECTTALKTAGTHETHLQCMRECEIYNAHSCVWNVQLGASIHALIAKMSDLTLKQTHRFEAKTNKILGERNEREKTNNRHTIL